MNKASSILLILYFLSSSCIAQKFIGRSIDNWKDCEIDSAKLPIHKLAGIGDLVWVTDYGDGNLYKTENGGESWSKIYKFNSEYIEVIQFLDEETGFVCGDYGYVYKTSNGGKTWKDIGPKIDNRIVERYRNDSTKNQEPDGQFIAYYGMCFKNEMQGFITGYCYNPSQGFRKSFEKLIFHTEDSGESWIQISNEEKDRFIDQFILGYKPKYEAIDGRYYFNSNRSATTEKDEDGKDVFEKQTRVKFTKKSYEIPVCPFEKRMLRNIVFLNEMKGFVFGGSLEEGNEKAIVYETSDSGKTWKLIESNLTHIHGSKVIGNYLWITGKEGMIKKKNVKNQLKKR